MFHILTIFKNHNAFLDQNLRTESGKKRLKREKSGLGKRFATSGGNFENGNRLTTIQQS